MSWFVYGGVLVILVLSWIAGGLHWQLYRVRRQQKQMREDLDSKREALRKQANDSIQFICRAYLQGQVRSAEASLRICGLMDQLQVPAEQRQEYLFIAKMADSIRHIPILSEWKALPRSQKREYEKYIEQKESELEPGMRQSIEKLIGVRFE